MFDYKSDLNINHLFNIQEEVNETIIFLKNYFECNKNIPQLSDDEIFK